jgi:hypothetical protein
LKFLAAIPSRFGEAKDRLGTAREGCARIHHARPSQLAVRLEILGSHLDVFAIGPLPEQIACGFRELDRLDLDLLHA